MAEKLKFNFKKVDPATIKSSLKGQIRSSQWRGLLDSFMELDEPATEVELEGVNRNGEEYKPQSVSGALYAVMRTSKKAGKEYPVSVKVRTEDDISTLYLFRTDMEQPEDETADADAEAVTA